MKYVCVYCLNERNSPNGTGSDVRCCGEVGHIMTTEEADALDAMDGYKQPSEETEWQMI